MLFLQTNDTANANGTVAYDPYDVTTWTPEQIKAWWDWTFFFLGIVQDIKYFSISVFALVVYEYFITLHLEAELVYGWRHWKKKVWNIPNILFFINRYFIFVVLGMSNLTLFWPEPPTQFCSFAVRFNSLSGIIITIVANGSLIIRQYAFWNRNKAILWSLVLLHLGSCVGGIVAGVTGFQGMTQSPKWQRGLPTGCLMTPPKHIWASFVGIMVFDVVLFNLTVIQAWRLRRESGSSHSPIISHLLTSGSLYFGIMFATTTISFVAAITNNNKLVFVMTPSNILPAMTSIMCSRLLLHIRSDLKEAKTPHLRTRATADWPSSPMSPDVEGMFRQMPWRDDAPLDSPLVAHHLDESLPQALEKQPSDVVHASERGPNHLGSTSTEASAASGSRSRPRHRDAFGSSFELRGSSLSQGSTEKTDSMSARY